MPDYLTDALLWKQLWPLFAGAWVPAQEAHPARGVARLWELHAHEALVRPRGGAAADRGVEEGEPGEVRFRRCLFHAANIARVV